MSKFGHHDGGQARLAMRSVFTRPTDPLQLYAQLERTFHGTTSYVSLLYLTSYGTTIPGHGLKVFAHSARSRE